MARDPSSAILFELLRSFTMLARSLNLSRAVRELGSTRQTVRRHIALLEENKGEAMFVVKDRQYQLTEAGRRALPEAERLLSRGEAWLNDQSGHISGLFRLAIEPKTPDNDVLYYLQQHPLGQLWSGSSPLLQYGFKCWANAEGRIESPEFAAIRPYIIVFREFEGAWICTEIGDESSYATWHGWKWQRSSIGSRIGELPGGTGVADLLMHPFRDVLGHEAARLDHIYTRNKRKDSQGKIPISYQRLLMGCWLPDDSFALVALIDLTHNIEINGLSAARATSMNKEYIMDVDVTSLKSINSASTLF